MARASHAFGEHRNLGASHRSGRARAALRASETSENHGPLTRASRPERTNMEERAIDDRENQLDGASQSPGEYHRLERATRSESTIDARSEPFCKESTITLKRASAVAISDESTILWRASQRPARAP